MDEGKALFLHKEGITNQQNMHVTSLLEPELVSCAVYETHCVHFNQFDSDKSSFEKSTANSVVTVVTKLSFNRARSSAFSILLRIITD